MSYQLVLMRYDSSKMRNNPRYKTPKREFILNESKNLNKILIVQSNYSIAIAIFT